MSPTATEVPDKELGSQNNAEVYFQQKVGLIYLPRTIGSVHSTILEKADDIFICCPTKVLDLLNHQKLEETNGAEHVKFLKSITQGIPSTFGIYSKEASKDLLNRWSHYIKSGDGDLDAQVSLNKSKNLTRWCNERKPREYWEQVDWFLAVVIGCEEYLYPGPYAASISHILNLPLDCSYYSDACFSHREGNGKTIEKDLITDIGKHKEKASKLNNIGNLAKVLQSVAKDTERRARMEDAHYRNLFPEWM